MKHAHKHILAAIIALVPATAFAQDWTGAYGGGSLGGISGEPSAGVFLGYQHQFSSVVIGAELGYAQLLGNKDSDQTVTGALEQFTDFSVHAGYAFDDVLVYGRYGATTFSTKGSRYDADVGALAAIGVNTKITDNVIVGGEYSYRIPIITNILSDSEEDADLQQVSLRLTYQF